MNKNAKGAIAVGAATVLLLGGGGTLAVWNASENVTGGSIYAGQLALGGTGEGTWYAYDSGKALDCAEYDVADELAANHVLVPGDDVIYCINGLDLTAQGTNLYFIANDAAGAVTVTGNGAPAGTSGLIVISNAWYQSGEQYLELRMTGQSSVRKWAQDHGGAVTGAEVRIYRDLGGGNWEYYAMRPMTISNSNPYVNCS